jgi:Ca2+-binding RTX toxin-like protein
VSGNAKIAECKLPGDVFFVSIWGGGGNDDVTIGNRLGRNTTSHASGGPDSDVLYGGDGEDVLFTGDTGSDHLMGNAGDDALLSESNGTDQAALGPAYGGGPDVLDAGPGNDQLVSDYPCGGHKFFGAGGFDIAGFARVGDKMHIRAQLGGDLVVSDRTEFWGRALSPERCEKQKNLWTELAPDLEVLEGAELSDELFGDDENNVIWGRGGGDTIRGFGGSDWLDGHKGGDVIFGGAGKDWIHGGDDYDYIHAKDGIADGEVSCGTAGGKLSDSDPTDPAGGCN